MDADVSSGPSGGYPRRSGRTRRSGGPGGDATHGITEPSIHPFVGTDPSSPKPLDAARLGLDRLRIILSGDAGEEISSFSFQKRLNFVNVPDKFIKRHFYTDQSHKRALPQSIDPPPKLHRRTLAQIRKWYDRFGHTARDEIIAKESQICVTTKFDNAAR